LLGDSLSLDNKINKENGMIKLNNENIEVSKSKSLFDGFTWNYGGGHCNNGWPLSMIKAPMSSSVQKEYYHPYNNVIVINKLLHILFNKIIEEYKLPYDIDTNGYQWFKLQVMMREHGLTLYNLDSYWQGIFEKLKHNVKCEYKLYDYDFTWKSFKELFDITI